MNHIIEVSHLSKSYDTVKAVKDISFYVEEGKLFAFLGPNGAGKSTTINTICTFLQPNGGEVRVNGYRLGKEDDAIRKSLGTVFQEGVLDKLLTVEENLELRGRFYGLRKKELKNAIKKAAEVTEITEFIKRPYGKLSGGQRRRADIARALIHTPKILFLDEPTTGLDPQTRRSVWETVKRLQIEQKMTVFLTTHYMEEAEAADYCIIVDHGLIAAKGTPFLLKEQYAKDKLILKAKKTEPIMEILKQNNISFERKEDMIQAFVSSTMDALSVLNECTPFLADFAAQKGSMDDVFLNITGRGIRE